MNRIKYRTKDGRAGTAHIEQTPPPYRVHGAWTRSPAAVKAWLIWMGYTLTGKRQA